MPSDDERSEKKFTYDGGDWRRLTSRIKPVLYEKKSEAYPDKNLFQLLLPCLRSRSTNRRSP